MSRRIGNLKPAHQGYRYQDILSAYFLVLAVVDNYESVTIDEKQVEDDRFDDIEISVLGIRIRRQVKSSVNPTRRFTTQDLTANSSSLRIDRLVLTARQEPGVAEYRLCATWDLPEASDPVFGMLFPVIAVPSIGMSRPSCFRLSPDLIWPNEGSPVWSVLSDPIAAITRDEFVEFCGRFLIELKLPQASKDLAMPGPLETAVTDLLSDRVGIGRYPNQLRYSGDVAALAVGLATLARTHRSKIKPEEIASYLELQLDYGRVSQAFPIDVARFYNRPEFRQLLRVSISDGGVHTVVAAPGSGKSWELTKLAEELSSNSNVIVARHYCYLEPGDEQIERRITSDVFFGNLIAELHDAAPALKEFPRSYAADLNTLESTLANAHSLGKPVVVIVDGLDHIARILAASNSLSEDEADIIEQLATLNIPNGVALILGSQPGKHLDVLYANIDGAIEHQLPTWTVDDMVGMSRVLRVPEALSAASIVNDDEIDEIITLLAYRSEGNPLYGRYLSTGLIEGIEAGKIDNPTDWLQSSPNLQGNIATYYQHLYASISTEAQVIADIFGTIDFSVQEEELRQILPSVLHDWISPALIALSPILSRSATQGGMRVFHESFRRFMLDELARQGRHLQNVLNPVIAWLENRGFFIDAKSYRFLLPLLRRADRNSDVLRYVGTSFVSESVSCAHPSDAIQRNLALAAEIAARIQDWPFLVRCSELRRMLSTCFDDGNNSWNEFWETYADLHGADALAERLLFDGKPTQSREDGLLACKIVDDLGGTPPWKIYLDLPVPTEESSYRSDNEDDSRLLPEELVTLATVQGRLRINQKSRILRRVHTNLTFPSSDARPFFVFELAKLLTRLGHERYVLKLASRGDSLIASKHVLRADFSTYLRLGVSAEIKKSGDIRASVEIATIALRTARTPESIISCVEHGASIDQLQSIEIDPTEIDLSLGGSYLQSSLPIREWISKLRLSFSFNLRNSLAESERVRVDGAGWYRCWLKYVISLAEVETAARRGSPYDIKNVISLLSQDVEPFRGRPRPCDLYRIHYVIKESLERCLALIRTKEEFDFFFETLLEVNRGTSSRLDREDGGPISIGALIDVLMTHLFHPGIAESVRAAVTSLIDEADLMGTYYSVHATYTMRLVKVFIANGQLEAAKQCWAKIGTYLTGYGWRKDITLFDIIESVPAIGKVSQKEAIRALVGLQPLISAVVLHTDGRSTNRASNAWLRSLFEVEPSTGLELLATSILEREGEEWWVTLQGIKDAIKALLGKADPLLLNAVWETIAFRIEYDNAAGFEAKERIDPLRELFPLHTDVARDRTYRLAAEFTNNETRRNKEAVDMLNAFAAEQDMSIWCVAIPDADRKYGRTSSLGNENLLNQIDSRHPYLFFQETDNYVALLGGIRKISAEGNGATQSLSSAIQYLSYRLPEIAAVDESGAKRIVRFLAHELELPYSLEQHPLLKLAVCLENAGCTKLSAIAYALAYAYSRGGGGWLNLGDEKHSAAMHRAIELDREVSLQTIADEIGRRLRHIDYGAGISRHLIERIAEWGQPAAAVSAWNEAFSVISQRLPLNAKRGWLASLEADALSTWTIDEGLVVLLLVRLGEPRSSRKTAALCGLLSVIKKRPDALPTALAWWMSRDTPISSLLLVFSLLYQAEPKPYSITQALQQPLFDYARADCWGVAILASQLLSRAGLAVPTQSLPKSLGNSSKPSKRVIETIQAIDEAGILEHLVAWWPDLPALVANRYGTLQFMEGYEERIRDRLALAFGRDGKSKPWSEVLLWQHELFLVALHTEMMGFRHYLWSNGKWRENIEHQMLWSMLPSLHIHLGLWNSRVARPDWGLPQDTEAGASNLKTVSPNDDRYAGWIRLGLIEHQYLNGSEHSRDAYQHIMVMSGVVASPLGKLPSVNYRH